MKVLMISGLYPYPKVPQYSIFIKELGDAVRSEGIELEIAVPMRKSTLRKNGLDPKGEWVGHVCYFPCFSLPKYFNLAFDPPFLIAALKKMFGKRLEKYDIFHAHGTLPEGVAAVELAKKYGKKSIIQVHGYDVFFDMSTRNKILKMPNRRMCSMYYEKADLILGVSGYIIDRILEGKVKPRNTGVLYNGVNLKYFYPSEEKKTSDTFHIVTIGNLIPVKRICDVISAIKILTEKGYNVSLDIFGRGRLETSIKEQIEQLNLRNNIHMRGYQSVETIAKELRSNDAFILTSDYEAFGCVYIEAMASGVPVIASNNIGFSELIRDGENGLMVTPRHPEEIATCIERLINNPQLKRKIICSALETAHTYTWERAAKILKARYSELAARSADGAE